jgi:hypothetical protein
MLVSYTPQDMRFTRSQLAADGTYSLYVHLFAWPADNKVTVTALREGAPGAAGSITAVSLLGSTQKVEFFRDAAGLYITLPPWRVSEFANVLKISGLKEP